MLSRYAWMYGWWTSCEMFDVVQLPCALLNAPTSTSPAGRNRKSIVYAKNGSVPIQASERRLRPVARPGRSASGTTSDEMGLRPHLRRPVGCDQVLRRGLLRVRRELDLRVESGGRKNGQQVLRDHVSLRHVLEARGVRVTLQEDNLPLVGVEELLPEPSRPRMGRVSVDRLCVVGTVDAVRGNGHLPVRGRELLHVAEIEVVPVDRDRRLARRDRLRRRVDGKPVAVALQLGEEIDARPDIAERAAVRE